MKHIITLFLAFLPILAAAQEFAVASFELREMDLTAINEATKLVDDNNEVCALIKIETTEKGFTFDGGTVGIAKVEDNHNAEIWVYVPAGLRKITIMHQQFGVIRDYFFPVTLVSARTYLMKLKTPDQKSDDKTKQLQKQLEEEKKQKEEAQQKLLTIQENKQNESNEKLAFFVKGVKFTMIKVSGGTFQMGIDTLSDDQQVHSVTLTDYYIGETEVTQSLWMKVMGNNPSITKSDELPVENVSWNDCQKFINELNKITGQHFALPTEAQWEYAARGGINSIGYKYSGSNSPGEVAWFRYTSGGAPHPVGSKRANELGLYDMSGNVYELCYDWYGVYGSQPVTNPVGSSTGTGRVRRGGSWLSYKFDCRPNIRSGLSLSMNPDERNKVTGLRLVLIIEETEQKPKQEKIEYNDPLEEEEIKNTPPSFGLG